jgi:hypothetical protein
LNAIEVIEIGCIAIAAFVMAGDEALRHAPNVGAILPRLRGSWRFLPATLVSIAAILFIAQALGFPNYIGIGVSLFVLFAFLLVIWRTIRTPHASSSIANQHDLASRIFHFRSEVNFRNLRDEHRITFTLSFFNASNEIIVLDDVTGSIAYNNFPEAGVQPSPQLGQRKTDNGPLQAFEVAIEQHVSRELIDNLLNHLCGGEYITLSLEHLVVPMRSKSGSEPFSARLRQGIVCTRKQDVIVFEHLVISALGGHIESRASFIDKS